MDSGYLFIMHILNSADYIMMISYHFFQFFRLDQILRKTLNLFFELLNDGYQSL